MSACKPILTLLTEDMSLLSLENQLVGVLTFPLKLDTLKAPSRRLSDTTLDC